MFIIAFGLIGLSLFTPMVAFANSDLVSGDQGVVSGDAALRTDPSFDAAVVTAVPDGTPVSIIEGVVTASDGSLWYFTSVLDVTGYLPAGAIASRSPDVSTEDVPQTEDSEDVPVGEETTAIPWKEAVDYGVVVNNTGEALPEGGLACRGAAAADANVITRVAEGSTLEITGDEVWIDAASLYPVNCAGQGGFVKGEYVVLASAQTEVEEVVATEEVVDTDQVVTEEVAPDESPVPSIDEDAAQIPMSTGDLIVTLQDADALPVSGACFQLVSDVSVVADACDTTDAIPDNGNSGFFGITAGTYQLVASSTPEDSSVDTQDVTIVGGERRTALVVLVTPVDAVPDEVATDVATDVVAPEVVVVPEEVAGGVVATDVAPEVVVVPEEVAADVVATDVAAPEDVVVPEEVAAEVVATDVATEVAAPEKAVETEEAMTAEVATEKTATTDERATEPAATVVVAASNDATTAPDPEGLRRSGATSSARTTENRQRVDTSQSIGSAEVQGTNGDGLRCRTAPNDGASTITVLDEGLSVIVLSEAQDGYLGIVCADQAGWANVKFLWSGGLTQDEIRASSDFSAAAATATISGTNGDGVRCRSGASTSSSIIAVIPEGTKVVTRGSASGGWVPINCYGYSGFVSASYISMDGGGSTGTAPDTSSGTVRVTGTGGTGLRCRSGASMSAGVITVLAEGASTSVRGGASGGWLPVTCAGQNGFVSTQYVSGGTSGAPPSNPPGGGGSTATGTGTISGTNGDGVRCRTGASTGASVIAVIPEGTKVATRGGASGGWVPINCYGYNGYVSAMYLTVGGGSGTTPAPTPNPTPTLPTGLVANDHASTSSNLNLRYSASMGAGVAAVAPAGTVVLITGAASNNFYPIDWDGLRGFMGADYLVKTSAALSERGGSAAPAPPPPTTGGGGSNATGNAMADFALRYQGYPYVWATSGPSSFDCSGFTYWVTKNVTGKDIGTGLWTQVSGGTPVSRANLQPGDLVFFQNTYKPGLSHSGVYIGNNQFIHSENETTGVKISDLNSTYYGSRWYGAVRMT